MKVYVGADHAGFRLKESVKAFLRGLSTDFEDLGNTVYDKNDDYPVFAAKVGKKVVASNSKGILFCGSSQGICIAANKIKGVRAVAVNTVEDVKLTRQHNDANILCLSGWKTSKVLAEKLIKSFLFTKFSNIARHKRRINEIKKMEK